MARTSLMTHRLVLANSRNPMSHRTPPVVWAIWGAVRCSLFGWALVAIVFIAQLPRFSSPAPLWLDLLAVLGFVLGIGWAIWLGGVARRESSIITRSQQGIHIDMGAPGIVTFDCAWAKPHPSEFWGYGYTIHGHGIDQEERHTGLGPQRLNSVLGFLALLSPMSAEGEVSIQIQMPQVADIEGDGSALIHLGDSGYAPEVDCRGTVGL